MRTIAILHKPYFWAGVVLTLPLAPILAICLQATALPSVNDYVKLDDFVQKQWQSQFGPDITPKLLELDAKLKEKLTPAAFESLTTLMNYRSMMVPVTLADATTVSRCVEATFGDLVTSYAAVSRSGGAYLQPRGKHDLNSSAPIAMLMSGCLLSGVAAESGNWDKAISRAEEAAHIYDGYRALGESAQMEAAFARARVYSLYRMMLGLHPNAVISRRLVKSLQGLQDSEPVYNEMPALGFAFDIENERGSLYQDYGPSLGTVAMAVGRIPFGFMRLHDAVSGITNDLNNLCNSTAHSVSAAQFMDESPDLYRLLFPWTNIWARKAFLRQAIRTDSPRGHLADLRHWNPALKAGFDPALVAMYDYFQFNYDYFQRVARTRLLRTQNLMLQVAFASRAFREDHDRWPGSLDELSPVYIQFHYKPNSDNPNELYMLKTASDPMLAIRVGMTTVTTDSMTPRLWMYQFDQGNHIADMRIDVNEAHQRTCHARLLIDMGDGPQQILKAARCAMTLENRKADPGASVTLSIWNDMGSYMTTPKVVSVGEAIRNVYAQQDFEGRLCGNTTGTIKTGYPGSAKVEAHLNLPDKMFRVSLDPVPSSHTIGANSYSVSDVTLRPMDEYPEGW